MIYDWIITFRYRRAIGFRGFQDQCSFEWGKPQEASWTVRAPTARDALAIWDVTDKERVVPRAEPVDNSLHPALRGQSDVVGIVSMSVVEPSVSVEQGPDRQRPTHEG